VRGGISAALWGGVASAGAWVGGLGVGKRVVGVASSVPGMVVRVPGLVRGLTRRWTGGDAPAEVRTPTQFGKVLRRAARCMMHDARHTVH
jgi:hypothetical protein